MSKFSLKILLKRILGIKTKTYGNKTKHYFLGIPVWKIRNFETVIKIYFCGLKVLSIPNYSNSNSSCINLQDFINIKALEILKERENISYEVEQ